MFEFALWPLWRQLKEPLKSLLGSKFSLVGAQFKGLLSSTVDDLIATLQRGIGDTHLEEHLAEGKIWDKKGNVLLTVSAFPVTAIEQASNLRVALACRLAQNVRLDAARTAAGVNDAEWQGLLETYAGHLLRLALPFAIQKMKRDEIPLYRANYVVDLADMEPIRINGVAGFHRLVILHYYDPAFSSVPVAKAQKIWGQRMSNSYVYRLGEYDDKAA